MADHEKAQDRGEEFWHSGKVTRRRLIGWSAAGAGALGATMLAPAPWQAAFGQAKPYKIGTLQPLSGLAAAGGKTSLVGVQMAVDRINKSGGINGRPVDLIVADYESKPDVGRRKAEKLVVEDQIDAHVGGYLSNVCLACMPVYDEHKIVNMVGVCLDTTITTSKCSRYTFRPFDYAPAQAVAFAPYLVGKMGKKWHIAYLDYAWGQSTRDAYVEEIRKHGGEVVGGTGIPLGTADMTSFLSQITGNFDGLFGILFGANAVTFISQAFDLGLTRGTGSPVMEPWPSRPTCPRSAARSKASSASTATCLCWIRRSIPRSTESFSTMRWRVSSRSTRRGRCQTATCSRTTRP
jgi:ABC-type branched-subunit amino acid transport system substrate-binding protein